MNFKNLFLIIFFYFVYTIRIIISIPVNALLLFILLFPESQNRLKKFHIWMHNFTDFDKIMDSFEKTIAVKNRTLNYLSIAFTLHPIFYIILGVGDCLTHSHFVKWCYIKWCIANKKEIPDIKIVEILSISPLIKGNHAFLYYYSNGKVCFWTPYQSEIIIGENAIIDNRKDKLIEFFEKKYGNEYINYLFPVCMT
jgi:hypothetical protein